MSVSGLVTPSLLVDRYGTSLLSRSSFDAFGRFRTSHPQTVWDSKQISDTQPLFFDDQQTAGAGTSTTFNTNAASTTIAVSNTTSGTRVRQSFRRFNYQPGHSQLIAMTWVSTAAAAGITKRIGQFDASNGVFFEQSGTALRIVRRTNVTGTPTDNATAQSSWNIDKLDGTGPSGITLDVTKTQLMFIDYAWQGVGSIRFGFMLRGQIVLVHEIDNSNTSLALPWSGNPNLPLRYEISNDGTGGVASLTHICVTVITEGGRADTGLNFSVDRGSTALTTLNDANVYPLVAIRLRSGYMHAQVVPKSLSVISTTNAAIRWGLFLNPTVTGTALSFSTVTNSAVEADVARTNGTTISGGTLLASGYGVASANPTIELENDLVIGASIAGVSDIMVLGAARMTGTTEGLLGAITWHEAQ